jgi:hypothetical protein
MGRSSKTTWDMDQLSYSREVIGLLGYRGASGRAYLFAADDRFPRRVVGHRALAARLFAE